MTSFSHLKMGHSDYSNIGHRILILGCLWGTCRRRVVGSPVDRCAAGVSLTGSFFVNNAEHKRSREFKQKHRGVS